MSFLGFGFPVYFALLLAAYGLVPGRWRGWVLVLGSWGFYLRSGPESLGVLLALTGLTVLGSRRKGAIPWVIAGQLGVLVLFKLRLGFSGTALPMGISFYLFSSVGYLLELHRGREYAGSIRDIALFTGFFPQMVQGPIRRFGPPELPALSREELRRGLQRMLWGYFKKLVIADRLAPAVAALQGMEEGFWLLSALYSFQIWADFTGGMDIALGAARAFGMRLPENFDRPFLSRSIAEYWRRWHITLGAWMKDYIFYPLSVSRPLLALSRRLRSRHPKLARKAPVYIATTLTWAATGLWHGITPNFLIWGMANCAVILLSQELTPLYRRARARCPWMGSRWYGAFQVLRTWILMNLIRAWDLFPNPMDYLRGITRFAPVDLSRLGLTGLDWGILAVAITIAMGASLLPDLRKTLEEKPALREAALMLLALALLLLGCYGIKYDAQSFIYNQF